jgi:uncharacterized membrane protein/protein-disulfide isomerase
MRFGKNPTARLLSFLFGVGMAAFSVITIKHFFDANYPLTIYEGGICDINAFFNCDSSAHSILSQVAGVPLGYFGLVVGLLVSLGALFHSNDFERTNRTLAFLNVLGVVTLFLVSVFILKSLCLYCSGFYVFSILSLMVYWKYPASDGAQGFVAKYLRPSWMHLATYGVLTLVGAYGFALYHEARRDAQSGGVATRIVREFYSLPEVAWPSFISPLRTAQATENFEDAPIRIVEYADLLCPDCRFLAEQMDRLKEEFDGQMNVAFQHFPLEGLCNEVVAKDLHPGACEVAYIATYDPGKFKEIHDEVFANLRAARDPEWRLALAQRHGVEAALRDSTTIDMVHRMIATGAEYEKTSDQFEHGIRSTPTMIINGRMVIGTLPYDQLRAIFQALVDEYERGEGSRFIENWEPNR